MLRFAEVDEAGERVDHTIYYLPVEFRTLWPLASAYARVREEKIMRPLVCQVQDGGLRVRARLLRNGTVLLVASEVSGG